MKNTNILKNEILNYLNKASNNYLPVISKKIIILEKNMENNEKMNKPCRNKSIYCKKYDKIRNITTNFYKPIITL